MPLLVRWSLFPYNGMGSLYLGMTDMPVPVDELYVWSEEVQYLACLVVDIVILLKKQKEGQSLDDREQWIIRNSLSSYCLELELIDRVEK